MFCPEAAAIGAILGAKKVIAAMINKPVFTTGTDNEVNNITEFFVGLTNPLIINAANVPILMNLTMLTITFPYAREVSVPSKILSVEQRIIFGSNNKAAMNSALTSLLYNLKINPATKPATAVFVIQVIIVPIGVMAKKKLIVDGAVKTNIPSKIPNNIPPIGPYNIAPTAIGNKANVIETGPNWTWFDNNCKTTTIADKMPIPAIVLTVKNLFFIV